MSQFSVMSLPGFADTRGALTVLEDKLPFDIRRLYWIYDAAGETRGGHRHRKTRQALVAVSGRIAIYLNDGAHEATVVLDHPGQCLLVEPEDWHTMAFGEGSVLLVMASEAYDKNDYIDEKYA